RCCGAVGLPSVPQRPHPMQRSARTAHTIRPSRSGSSTMQSATGQAAWQIEQAKAPKQRSGSITAMVLGAFLRGPLIILVHIVRRLYQSPWTSLRVGLLSEDVAAWRVADFGHDREERHRIFEDLPVCVDGEIASVVIDVDRIRGRLVGLPRFSKCQPV